MDLSSLKKSKGATQDRKRIGRGTASGQGGTAGRGHKGARSRSGGKTRAWFEGGQMPIQRRLPKFGFYNHSKKVFQVVNLSDLDKFADVTDITPEALQTQGLIKKADMPVKILGNGEIKRKLSVHAHAFSKTAREKIEKAGGSVTEL
jgi:large subunit ribosomal protein L15